VEVEAALALPAAAVAAIGVAVVHVVPFVVAHAAIAARMCAAHAACWAGGMLGRRHAGQATWLQKLSSLNKQHL